MNSLRKLLAAALPAGMILAALLMPSCSRKAEQVSAMETADQMEAAKAGREAAKKIITKNWTDTMQLQEALLSARAENSKYEMEGKASCKASFDTAFVNTIRTVRPDLARQLDEKLK